MRYIIYTFTCIHMVNVKYNFPPTLADTSQENTPTTAMDTNKEKSEIDSVSC